MIKKRNYDMFDNIFDNMFQGLPAFGGSLNSSFSIENSKIITENGRTKILIPMPGFKKESISVNIEKGFLLVSAENSLLGEKKLERKYSLSEDVDLSSIQSTYTDGVLSISLTGKPNPHPAKINIPVE